MAKKKIYGYRVENNSSDWSHEGPTGTLREAVSRAVQALSDNTGIMSRAHMNQTFSQLMASKGGKHVLADYTINIWEIQN